MLRTGGAVGRAVRCKGVERVTDLFEPPVRLPPAPPWPQFVQDIAYLTRGLTLMHGLYDRFGTAFSIRLPFFGPAVVISDPALVRELFRQSTDDVRGADRTWDWCLGLDHRSACKARGTCGTANYCCRSSMATGCARMSR